MGAKSPANSRSLWMETGFAAGPDFIHRLFMSSPSSSQQDLLQLRVVAREFLVALAQLRRLAAGVQDGGVVAAAEGPADLRQALLRELLGERHRDLARAGHGAEALLRVHLRDLDLEVVGHGLLD